MTFLFHRPCCSCKSCFVSEYRREREYNFTHQLFHCDVEGAGGGGGEDEKRYSHAHAQCEMVKIVAKSAPFYSSLCLSAWKTHCARCRLRESARLSAVMKSIETPWRGKWMCFFSVLVRLQSMQVRTVASQTVREREVLQATKKQWDLQLTHSVEECTDGCAHTNVWVPHTRPILILITPALLCVTLFVHTHYLMLHLWRQLLVLCRSCGGVSVMLLPVTRVWEKGETRLRETRRV